MKRLKQISAALFATIAAVPVQAEPVAITQNLSSGDYVYTILRTSGGMKYAAITGVSTTDADILATGGKRQAYDGNVTTLPH